MLGYHSYESRLQGRLDCGEIIQLGTISKVGDRIIRKDCVKNRVIMRIDAAAESVKRLLDFDDCKARLKTQR